MSPSMLTTVVPGSKMVPSHLQSQYKYQEQQPATFNPNRLSLPNANILRLQQQAQLQQQLQQKPSHKQLFMQQLQQQQHQEQQQQQQQMYEKSTPKPRLSLDTSDERLQNITFVSHNNRRYMKLFSPSLVDSPVTFLDKKQLLDDKKLWENGPDMAFQKQLETEKREAWRARSKQQMRGFFMGLWLGCLMGFLILQWTSAKVLFWRQEDYTTFTPLVAILVLISSAAIVRSGTRCTIAAVATCAAVLTCFATLIVNQSHYAPEFHIYRRTATVVTLP
ncbi:hypothetical protein EC957_006216 [Mortierella hygrophila]|uniref:Uncharacterized protein n=1 Tax=Mortierella hygrophila TaxID=979708 RepID=A0A9P6JZ77_9FUNG|nr:hypothetical protein EC957_006216 [Mortierella hygrophila]